MKKMIQYPIFVVLFLLIAANAFTFISGMGLGDQINHYEQETKKLHLENTDLENQVYSLDSLHSAESVAKEMQFTKQSTPVYLESLSIALNR